MKKSLIALSMLLAASAMAMAHGPPSVLDSSVMTQTSIAPSVGGSRDIVSNSGGSGGIIAMHGGGSGGITQMPGPIGREIPRNERMLN